MSTARLVHDRPISSGTVKAIYSGNCLGCGECCSRFLPLSAYDVGRIEEHVSERGIEQRPERGGIDLLCPYLTEDRKCAIYDARPDICRCYRCDEHARGDFRAASAILMHPPYGMRDMRGIGGWRS